MKLAITIAGTAALTIAGSVAFADQTMTGTVTRIDRTNGTVVIQQTQDGTVGAGAGNVAEQFKTQNGSLLDAVHAGDRVTFSVTGTGDTKTITNFEKPQK
jgi:Cu/Ag efflux protein CusF